MTRTIAAAAAELAILTPRLDDALTRDNTTPGHAGITAGTVVNTDVLEAVLILNTEVVPAMMLAAEMVSEPWQPRDLDACWIALPRFAARLWNMSRPADAQYLEDAADGWLRKTKFALGLRTRDLPLGFSCPVCEVPPAGDLYAAGSEGFLHVTTSGVSVTWEHAGRVYCTLCGAAWGMSEWPLLGRVLEAAAS